MHARNSVRSVEKSLTLADSPYTVLPYIYNVIKVNTTGGNVRVNLPTVDYPIDVIKTSSDAYIVTIWVGGTQVGEVAGELSVVTIENAEVTVDEPWYPYDAIVGIAGVSGDGGEVLAKDRYGRVISGGRGVAGTDDGTILSWLLTLGGVVQYRDDLTSSVNLVLSDNSSLIGNNHSFIHLSDTAKFVLGNNIAIRNSKIKLLPSHRRNWMSATSVSGISIIDSEYDGNDDAIGNISLVADKSMASFSLCSDILVSRCTFHDSNGTGLNVLDSDTVRVLDCDFYNMIGYTLYGGYSPNTNAALFTNRCSNLQFINNYCKDIDDNAVAIISCHNAIMSNNVCENCITMAQVEDVGAAKCENVDIIENVAGPGSIYGITLGSPYGYPFSNVLVEGNKFYCIANSPAAPWVAKAAIYFGYNGGENVRFVGNTFICDSWVVYGLDSLVLSGMEFENNLFHGSYGGVAARIIFAPIANSIWNHNVVRSSAVYPVVSRMMWVQASGNHFHGNSFFGTTGSPAISVLSDNTFNENTFDVIGIDLTGLSGIILDGNIFSSGATITAPGINCVRRNYGFPTDASGSSTGTGSEQPIPHGLAAIPVGCKAWIKIEYPIGSGRYITKDIPYDVTSVYPTVDNGVAYEWGIA
jgi:hypothetical protein